MSSELTGATSRSAVAKAGTVLAILAIGWATPARADANAEEIIAAGLVGPNGLGLWSVDCATRDTPGYHNEDFDVTDRDRPVVRMIGDPANDSRTVILRVVTARREQDGRFLLKTVEVHGGFDDARTARLVVWQVTGSTMTQSDAWIVTGDRTYSELVAQYLKDGRFVRTPTQSDAAWATLKDRHAATFHRCR